MSASSPTSLCRRLANPPPLLVNLLPPTLFLGLPNLPLPWSNSPLQAVHPQSLRRPHPRHLAVQRHPHRVEQPRRHPVLLDVVALQRRCRSARRDFSKQLALHLAVQLSAGCQRGISRLTVPAHIAGDTSLLGGDRWTLRRIQASGCSMVSAALCHDDSIPERACGVASPGKVPQVTPRVVADVTITTITYRATAF